MAVQWDITDVHDWTLLDSDQVEAIVWTLFVIGLDRLDEDNIEKAAARTFAYEAIFGAMRVRDPEEEGEKSVPVPWTKDELSRYIGIKTNGPNISKSEFKRNIMHRIMREHEGHKW
jgi:hypothetical protein